MKCNLWWKSNLTLQQQGCQSQIVVFILRWVVFLVTEIIFFSYIIIRASLTDFPTRQIDNCIFNYHQPTFYTAFIPIHSSTDSTDLPLPVASTAWQRLATRSSLDSSPGRASAWGAVSCSSNPGNLSLHFSYLDLRASRKKRERRNDRLVKWSMPLTTSEGHS